MPAHVPSATGEIIRHFTVAVFVVHHGQVLLHFHPKLKRWLPPGGHVEANELPDDAAVREVAEETGLDVVLVGERGVPVDSPRQLVVPAGVQLEDIYPGHQHIDLVYFAVPRSAGKAAIAQSFQAADQVGWYQPGEIAARGASAEMVQWAARATREVGRPTAIHGS